MLKKLIVGAIATALLLSGGLIGVSFAGAGGITEPEVIELSLDLCGNTCRTFEQGDPVFGRPGQIWITVNDDVLLDVDGNRVGRQSGQCTSSYSAGQGRGTPWHCSFIVTLNDGPHTDAGTIVSSGIYTFETDTFAVTGGTGAYENVRGTVTMDPVDGREVLTLNLIP
jgi:hypothetical protein